MKKKNCEKSFNELKNISEFVFFFLPVLEKYFDDEIIEKFIVKE